MQAWDEDELAGIPYSGLENTPQSLLCLVIYRYLVVSADDGQTHPTPQPHPSQALFHYV